MCLKFQDFGSVDEYHLALSKIVYKLRLCGEVITDADLLSKTYSTFHPGDLLSRQIYIERGFTTYNEMLSCLFIMEQNKLLEKSSEMQNESEASVSKIRDGVAGLCIE